MKETAGKKVSSKEQEKRESLRDHLEHLLGIFYN